MVLKNILDLLTQKRVGSSRKGSDDLFARPPKAVLDLYPDTPVPDTPLSPMILAARWSSHDLFGEDMPIVAADLLEQGFDTPSLRRLAGEIQVSNSTDIEPLVGRVFHELGVRYPLTERECRLITSRQIAREVIAGWRNAWTAASHLEIVVWNRTPGSPELEEIFGVLDEYDWDSPERRPLAELDSALVKGFAELAQITIET